MTDWTQPDPEAHQHWLTLGREIGAICTTDDCERPHRARGMCSFHYEDWKHPGRAARRNRDVVTLERRTHGAVPIDDVEWLLECHPLMTAAEMAPRFEVKADSVSMAIRRAGRQDLLARLARNAELQRPSNARRTA